MELIEGHLAIDPPANVPVWDVDPYAEDILRDPMPFYRALREKGPFVYIPKYAVLACGRYAETSEVFSDHERFLSSRGVGLVDFKLTDPWRPASIILEVDPPEHTRVRRIMAKSLSPKLMRDKAAFLQEHADKMVAEVVAKGAFDAVPDLAERYPTTVFPQILGMKESNGRHLLDYGCMVFDSVGPDNELRRKSLAKGGQVVPWIMAQCARDNLTEDGVGADIYAYTESGEITEEEGGLLVRSLLSAGVDTTVTGIGSMLYCFAMNPEQWEILKEDPKRARPAFEEVLRYTSPVHSFCRTAGLDTEVAGVQIPESTKMLCMLGAANLDDTQWENAESFDIRRDPRGHVAMGAGIHGCVGQNLARAEVGAVLQALLEQVDRIELTGTPVWRPGNSIRTLDTLPIRLIPKAAA